METNDIAKEKLFRFMRKVQNVFMGGPQFPYEEPCDEVPCDYLFQVDFDGPFNARLMLKRKTTMAASGHFYAGGSELLFSVCVPYCGLVRQAVFTCNVGAFTSPSLGNQQKLFECFFLDFIDIVVKPEHIQTTEKQIVDHGYLE